MSSVISQVKMNGAAPFRSHLMQQFASVARAQSRPPIALFSMGGNPADGRQSFHRADKTGPTKRASHQYSLISSINDTDHIVRFSSSQSNSNTEEDQTVEVPSQHEKFQNLIKTRRTVSNFSSLHSCADSEEKSLDAFEFLRGAIKRGVECAVSAPNHKMTEPVTFYQVLSPSSASEHLLDIVYEVTLQKLHKQKLSGYEACKSEAMRKREKWAKIPAFVIATVGGMEDQTQSLSISKNTEEYYSELPLVPPKNIKQLEDYAASCASVQNLLLSLHAEGLGSKWATGPIIRTLAFRDFIRCQSDVMIVGLIFIGWPKRVPKMPRRRRELEADVLREL